MLVFIWMASMPVGDHPSIKESDCEPGARTGAGSGLRAKRLPNFRTEWRDLRREFESIRDDLKKTRVETEEQGRERAKDPKAVGIPELEENYSLVRFVSRSHAEQAEHSLQLAIDLIPTLEAMFEKQEATVRFLSAWGTFNELASVLTSARALMEDGLNNVRRAKTAADTKSATTGLKRRFIARLVAEKRKAGRDAITAACRAVARDISKFIKLNRYPANQGKEFSKEWFEDLLDPKSDSPKLRSTYRDHLTRCEIRELTATPDPTLDSIVIFFHNTLGSVPKT
jgi:hypothetical protein